MGPLRTSYSPSGCCLGLRFRPTWAKISGFFSPARNRRKLIPRCVGPFGGLPIGPNRWEFIPKRPRGPQRPFWSFRDATGCCLTKNWGRFSGIFRKIFRNFSAIPVQSYDPGGHMEGLQRGTFAANHASNVLCEPKGSSASKSRGGATIGR